MNVFVDNSNLFSKPGSVHDTSLSYGGSRAYSGIEPSENNTK